MQVEERERAERATEVDVLERHRGLFSRTALISVLTLLSRLAGFVRESLTAALFGDASRVSDALVSAWRVPNLFRALMAEGAIATAVQTSLTRADHEGGDAAGRAFFRAMLRLVVLASGAACLVALVIAWCVPDVAPGSGWAWLGRDPALVRELFTRMLPFIALVCVSAVLGGALNVRGVFFAPNLAPVAMNLGWIGALAAIGATHGWYAAGGEGALLERELSMARWLAGYVLVAGAILVLVPLPALGRAGLLARVEPASRAQARVRAREALWASVPQALGVSAHQCGSLITGWMALVMLPQGASSLLYYVARLQQLPLSLVAAAATNAVFPALAALGGRRDDPRLHELHARTQRAIAFVSIPASLGLFAFAEPILSVCFEHGAFGAAGVERAAWALRALALAIFPVGAAGLMARALYAVGDVRAPVRAAWIVLLVYVGVGFALARGCSLDLAGLAWGGCAAAWVHVACLAPAIRRRIPGPAAERTLRWSCEVVGAALAAVGGAWSVHRLLVSSRSSTLGLAICIFLAAATYALICARLGVDEWRAALARLRGSPARDRT